MDQNFFREGIIKKLIYYFGQFILDNMDRLEEEVVERLNG